MLKSTHFSKLFAYNYTNNFEKGAQNRKLSLPYLFSPAKEKNFKRNVYISKKYGTIKLPNKNQIIVTQNVYVFLPTVKTHRLYFAYAFWVT